MPCGIDAIRTTVGGSFGAVVFGTVAQMPGSRWMPAESAVGDLLHVVDAEHLDVLLVEPAVGDRARDLLEHQRLRGQVQLEEPVLHPDGKCGRQIVLNPCPFQVPGRAASGPRGSSMPAKGWTRRPRRPARARRRSRLEIHGSPSGGRRPDLVPGRTSSGEEGRSGRPRYRQPYSRSITSAYLAWTTRRLSLSVGVSSSDSAVHSVGRSSNDFTCSGPREPGVGAVDGLLRHGPDLGLGRQVGEVGELDAVRLRDDRGHLAVQGQHRDDVRPVVAERERVARRSATP